ncbi:MULTISPECIES: hypothetical protein [Streptomyces]|uniref:Uncharacterized protein n=1 Tax=Streptomyces fuscus TaxID=3048495 RepID=A0ABT7J422_9ACTN|nr:MULTISPECIES: hypothetical protein [Streptomyces]MCM1970784.1 hypothetical protein [Streptomyces sp. G1]MDL2079608.1 hypothetical protein [Streptomyces fuscus]
MSKRLAPARAAVFAAALEASHDRQCGRGQGARRAAALAPALRTSHHQQYGQDGGQA